MVFPPTVTTAGEKARDFCHVPRTNVFFIGLLAWWIATIHLQSIAEAFFQVKAQFARFAGDRGAELGQPPIQSLQNAISCSLFRRGMACPAHAEEPESA